MNRFQPRRRLRFTLAALVLGLALVAPAAPAPGFGARIVDAARAQIGVTLQYDPAYVKLAYPGGDVPLRTGVCSDVVVRALRQVGVDLQKELHEDMAAHFAAYPKNWGLKSPDKNIDHRRVPNLRRYFERRGWVVPGNSGDVAGCRAGDLVAWDLGAGLLHVGVVSDRTSPEGTPLVIHNLGQGTKEEDLLLKHRILGHYRPKELPSRGTN